jgi:hypothetical protein
VLSPTHSDESASGVFTPLSMRDGERKMRVISEFYLKASMYYLDLRAFHA